MPKVTPRKTKRRKLPRIVEIAQELGKKIPEVERRAVPPDFSSRLDHLRIAKSLRRIFADTLYWIAIFRPNDPWLETWPELVPTILDSDEIGVIPQSHESFQGGLALYERRPDKKYSLTDCITMNVMRREGITEILTNDHHFAQEGFRRLMSRREKVREE